MMNLQLSMAGAAAKYRMDCRLNTVSSLARPLPFVDLRAQSNPATGSQC